MREFWGWAKGAVASPFSVKYCFKRFCSKINAGINIVGNKIVPAPISEYSGLNLPHLFLQKESRGLKNHVLMKLIVDHSPLLSNVSCCVLLTVFLFPEKNYYDPLWLPSIKASWAVSEFFRHSWAPGGCKINVWGYTETLPFWDE